MKQPIDFEWIDGQPVDIVFLLLTPDGEPNKHLNVLACFSRKLRSPGVLNQMRAAKERNVALFVFCRGAVVVPSALRRVYGNTVRNDSAEAINV